MKRALTGVKATGELHFGRIMGSILPAIELQKTHDTFYFIADYHSLGTLQDAKAIRNYTYDIAAGWLALGLDPNKGTFYRQSDVPEVTEFCWLLSSSISLGELFRAHAFKAAKDQNKEGTLNLCTFSYPVLMAADIMLYDADVVPVGQDQLQHIEMGREIARRFNHQFGDCIKEPKELIQKNVATVPGIDGQKMSASYHNVLSPLASKKQLKKQVMSIITDSKELADIKDPDTCNIVKLYQLVANADELAEMQNNYRKGNYGYGHAKLALLEKLEETYIPVREKFNSLREDTKQLDEILLAGATKARATAKEVLSRARKACGFY